MSKMTFAEFKEHAKANGVEFFNDEDCCEEGHNMWKLPDDYVLQVNGDNVDGGIDEFLDNCDEIFEPNTIRVVFNIDDEQCISFSPDTKVEWAVFKRVFGS